MKMMVNHQRMVDIAFGMVMQESGIDVALNPTAAVPEMMNPFGELLLFEIVGGVVVLRGFQLLYVEFDGFTAQTFQLPFQFGHQQAGTGATHRLAPNPLQCLR